MKIDVSRILLLISLIALVVVVTGVDPARFFSISIPGNALFWIGVALVIFYATRGGCCQATERDADQAESG